jgi:hypothetical protein
MRPSRPQEGMNDMVSRFAILADLIRGPEAAPRQAQQDRKAERRDREARRRRSREDIAFGRRAFLEQARQAEESDPEAARLAHDKAMALLIVQAGARARGLPVPTRLIQDEPSFDREPSNEYPDDYHGPSKDPDDGDDSPVDDRDHKTRKTKKSKKAKDEDNTDEQAEDDEDAEDKPSKMATKIRMTMRSGAAQPIRCRVNRYLRTGDVWTPQPQPSSARARGVAEKFHD